MNNNEENKQTIQSNQQEIIWERCCELFIQAENGNNESFKELEEICQNNQNDVVCLGYFNRLMYTLGNLRYCREISRITPKIEELISNLKSNSSSFKHFIQNPSNKHQQFIYADFSEDNIGMKFKEEEYFRLLKLSADQGHVLAEFEMGVRYDSGEFFDENKELSFQYHKRAATKGYPVAQYQVGWCYEYGVGVSIDLSLSFQWYKKSAENGCRFAFNSLGDYYFLGRGTEVNEEEAMRWFQLAVDIENNTAMSKVGLFYHYGRIVERDRNKSIEILGKVNDPIRRDYEARYRVGLHYLQDQTKSSNRQLGFEILTNIKYSTAQMNICVGLCYEYGIGVERDPKKAFQLYYREAHNRDQFPLGIYNCGRCLEEGIGVDVMVEKARRWYNLTRRRNVDAFNRLREFKEDKVRVSFRNKQRYFH